MNRTDDRKKEDSRTIITRTKAAAKSTSSESTSGGDIERLQKLISRAGIASRRAAEQLIVEGRVSVNGKTVTELGAKADPQKDKIMVDGRPLILSEAARTVVLLHKPRGYVTTKHDPEGRATVLDLLPKKLHHLNPVGRLDFDTSGVLLLTDDGDLLHALTHPSRGVEKIYHARVGGEVLPGTVKRLEAGVEIVEEQRRVRTAPCRVKVRVQTANNALVEVALREGRNRQVRKMLEAVGHRVSSLRRVRFAGLELEEVSVGEHRVLLPGEVHALRKRSERKVRPRKPSTLLPQVSRRGGKASDNTRSSRSVHASKKRESASKPVPLGERIRREWR